METTKAWQKVIELGRDNHTKAILFIIKMCHAANHYLAS